MSPAPALVIREGTCHALLAFDIGREVRLEDAARILGAAPAPPAGEGRPPYLQFARPPVRCSVPVDAVEIGGRRTRGEAAVVVFDFGGAAVTFAIDASGTLADLARLSQALTESDALATAARRVVDDIVRRLGAAVDEPQVAGVLEEYVVFHARKVECAVPVTLWTEAFAADLARVLRAETGPLSAQEISQTLSAYAAYTPDDLALVDWNAAFVVRERTDDLLAVLTFANVQLLELRVLDARLDDALQRSYESVQTAEASRRVFPKVHRGALGQVARRQLDASLLFEHVRNAPKLLGDQYLARVYERAARRFRLADWDDSIHRKLEVLGSIYERLRDRAAIVRAEVLEWIIILIFLVSIVLPFVLPYGK